MTVSEILDELMFAYGMPVEAFEAATERKEAITPHLLGIFEEILENPNFWTEEKCHMYTAFSTYLLCQFNEKRAFPLFIQILSLKSTPPLDLFNLDTFDDLPSILATLYDGNRSLLEGLVENTEIDHDIRCLALSTFLVLLNTNQISREELLAYYTQLLRGRLTRTPGKIWWQFADALRSIGATELIHEIKPIFEDGLVEDDSWTWEDFEEELGDQTSLDEYGSLITDARAAIDATWLFHPDGYDTDFEDDDDGDFDPELFSRDTTGDPFIGPFLSSKAAAPPESHPPSVKIGRNDPCICGSGKKYKKCCG